MKTLFIITALHLLLEFDASQRGKETNASSAKAAFWFTDDVETAMSYANYAAFFGVPQRLVRDAQAKEHDAQLEQAYGNPEKAQRLFAEAEDLMQQAEDFELRQNRDPDARERGQTVIPVRVPKNLMVVDIGGESYYSGKISKFITEAKEKGFDGVKFLNLDDAVGLADRPATHIAIFDPAKIRSKFAPQQDVNQDADITINNMEEMDRIANHARGATLRKGLDAMLMKAGEGMLKSRKKSDPIGKLAENFDNSKMLTRELVKLLDPEGRETLSKVQIGLDGKGISDEDIKVLMPHIVRGLSFVQGSDAMDSGFLGQFRTVKSTGGKVFKRMIDMVDIGEKLGRSQDAETMTGEMFLETLLHEIGHGIEGQTPLRNLISTTQVLAGVGDPDSQQQVEDMVRISKARRRNHWDALEDGLMKATLLTGQPMPTVKELSTWQYSNWAKFESTGLEILLQQGELETQGPLFSRYLMKDAYTRWDYLSNPAELGADLVAYYFRNPAELKSKFPLQAKMVRKAVNDR